MTPPARPTTARLNRLRRQRNAWLIVTTALAAVCISSGWCTVYWIAPSTRLCCGITAGGIGGWHSQVQDSTMSTGFFFDSSSLELLWKPEWIRGSQSGVILPIWPFILISGGLALRAAIGARTLADRLAAGSCCAVCGYDLTGLTKNANESRTCPECGTTAPPPAPSKPESASPSQHRPPPTPPAPRAEPTDPIA